MDELDRDLAALAPIVDSAAARAGFEARRSQARRRRRVLSGFGLTAVVLVAVVGAVVLVDEPRQEVRVGAGGEDGPVVFEVLRMAAAAEPMGSVRSATTADGYAGLWRSAGLDGEPPPVDFAEQLVVSLTIPDDACPPELTGFERDGGTIVPTFVEPAGACVDPLIPKTFVVALDREPLEPGFTLRLPGQPLYGFGDTTSVVPLGAAAPVPDCGTVHDFAERLVDVGLVFDYDASESPAELLAANDIAFRGVLTGGFASTSSSGDPAGEFVAYEVQVTEWLYAGPEHDPLHERQFASVRYSPASVGADDLAAATRAAAGTPVVVVAASHDPAPGQLVASIEGFVTACDGGPLLGWVGTQGEWTGLRTLDDLAQALGTAPTETSVSTTTTAIPSVDPPSPQLTWTGEGFAGLEWGADRASTIAALRDLLGPPSEDEPEACGRFAIWRNPTVVVEFTDDGRLGGVSFNLADHPHASGVRAGDPIGALQSAEAGGLWTIFGTDGSEESTGPQTWSLRVGDVITMGLATAPEPDGRLGEPVSQHSGTYEPPPCGD